MNYPHESPLYEKVNEAARVLHDATMEYVRVKREILVLQSKKIRLESKQQQAKKTYDELNEEYRIFSEKFEMQKRKEMEAME